MGLSSCVSRDVTVCGRHTFLADIILKVLKVELIQTMRAFSNHGCGEALDD
jgi:hypothetical protein